LYEQRPKELHEVKVVKEIGCLRLRLNAVGRHPQPTMNPLKGEQESGRPETRHDQYQIKVVGVGRDET